MEKEYLFKEYQRKYAPILRLTIQPFIKADTYTSALISTQYYGELLLRGLNKPNVDIYGWSMSTSNPSLYWTKSVFLTKYFNSNLYKYKTLLLSSNDGLIEEQICNTSLSIEILLFIY